MSSFQVVKGTTSQKKTKTKKNLKQKQEQTKTSHLTLTPPFNLTRTPFLFGVVVICQRHGAGEVFVNFNIVVLLKSVLGNGLEGLFNID
eukprot:m.26435 g.26435  ORF g.26435 m.26435 type:complete len:89 (-) comp13767_c0_seq1:531-797(-)